MKVVAISDTHLRPPQTVPRGDLLIHAGDALCAGTPEEFHEFAAWFRRLPFDVKVYVPGNHDIFVEKCPRIAARALGPHTHLLIDEELVVGGLRIFGQPWVPRCGFWAFEHDRGSAAMACARQRIPGGLDILVTHSPPWGLCDAEEWWPGRAEPEHLGCRALRERVERVRPRVHVCGHIHGGAGSRVTSWGGRVINAACRVEVFEVEAA